MIRTPLLPSGRRRGLPFIVPDDWTPEQALAVLESLNDLLATIIDLYGDQLHEQLRDLRASRTIRTRNTIAVLSDTECVTSKGPLWPLRAWAKCSRLHRHLSAVLHRSHSIEQADSPVPRASCLLSRSWHGNTRERQQIGIRVDGGALKRLMPEHIGDVLEAGPLPEHVRRGSMTTLMRSTAS